MAWPIQLALIEKQLPYRSIQLSFSDGDNQTRQFLAMNPRGKVPVLSDDDITVYEAHAIIEYLERNYVARSLLPEERAAQARDVTRRLETTYIYPAADAAISYTSYSSTLSRAEWDPEHLARLSEPLAVEFSRWESYLDNHTWLGRDDRPGQSDVFFIPLMFYMHRFGFDFGERDLPNLSRYYDRALALQSVQDTWPRHWRDQPGDPTFARYTVGMRTIYQRSTPKRLRHVKARPTSSEEEH